MTRPQTRARPAGHAPIDPLDVVEPVLAGVLDVALVCHHCTGPHPVERCPRRVVCSICTGQHLAASHLA